MKRRYLHQGKDPIDLIEEAFHLLRVAPASSFACYYTGALPFVLGLLYFWADMSRGAFASERLPLSALGIGVLFLWMKGWQACFAQRIHAQLNDQTLASLTLRSALRLGMTQSILQPSGLFLLPPSLLLPFGWVYAFYQNVTVVGQETDFDLRQTVREARTQAANWPGQNHTLLALMFLFALVVFLNLFSAVFAIPQLLSILFGMETVFTQTPWALGNSTVLAAVIGLTYLCVDPIIKTLYVLRCFYGASIRSGADLRVDLRKFQFQGRRSTTLFMLFMSIHFGSAGRANAGDSVPVEKAQQASQMSVSDLDRAIDETISKPEYRWRLPRENHESEHNAFITLVWKIIDAVKRWTVSVGRLIRQFIEWLFRHREEDPPSASGQGWMSTLRWLVVLLAILLACVIGVLIYRILARRQKKSEAKVMPPASLPDVSDETVGADQLPEDDWLQLARDLREKGELRLALRAYYLASLAHLAQRNLITLARFKSNHDYESELQRRAHAMADLLPTFARNVSIFDRVWYGLREVNQESLRQFSENVEKIRANL